jgi:hypothetical protein
VTTALKVLLTQRHLHEYSEFAAEYRRCAVGLDLPRNARVPTKAQYYKWLGGQLHGLPRGYHCSVLERMFPGWSARQLFDAPASSAPADEDDLLVSVGPTLDPAVLNGVWATCYKFDGVYHHADLSVITMSGCSMAARNYPPEPRTESHAAGYRNNIDGTLSGRHILGRWRNVSDDYFFGTLHLAALPAENVLDGVYSGFPADTQIVAERWRWVRVAMNSPRELAPARLRDPHDLYEMLMGRSAFDGPVRLDELTED